MKLSKTQIDDLSKKLDEYTLNVIQQDYINIQMIDLEYYSLSLCSIIDNETEYKKISDRIEYLLSEIYYLNRSLSDALSEYSFSSQTLAHYLTIPQIKQGIANGYLITDLLEIIDYIINY